MPNSRRNGFDVGVSSALAEVDVDLVIRNGPPTALTASAGVSLTANTLAYGSWVEIDAATAAEYGGLLITAFTATSGSARYGLVSVGVGAAGAEVEIAYSNSGSHGTATTTGSTPQVYLPVRIPKGSRIAMRAGTSSATVHVSAYPAAPGLPTKLESMGITIYALPWTISASSAWTQITAATNSAYRGLIMVPGAGVDTMSAETGVTFTLGIGASGAEVSIGTCEVNTTTTESLTMRLGTSCDPVVRHIPKGTRIAIKQTSAQTYFQGSVIGIPY